VPGAKLAELLEAEVGVLASEQGRCSLASRGCSLASRRDSLTCGRFASLVPIPTAVGHTRARIPPHGQARTSTAITRFRSSAHGRRGVRFFGVPYRFGVPLRDRDEVLNCLVRPAIADRLPNALHRFPLGLADQALNVTA
jgi:hypothetical protein